MYSTTAQEYLSLTKSPHDFLPTDLAVSNVILVYFFTGRYQSVGLIKKKPTRPSPQSKGAARVFS